MEEASVHLVYDPFEPNFPSPENFPHFLDYKGLKINLSSLSDPFQEIQISAPRLSLLIYRKYGKTC